jgi:hypothetical protein
MDDRVLQHLILASPTIILKCLAEANNREYQIFCSVLVHSAAHWGTALAMTQVRNPRLVQGPLQAVQRLLILAIFQVWAVLEATVQVQSLVMDSRRHCGNSSNCWCSNSCYREMEQVESNKTTFTGSLCREVPTVERTSPWQQKTSQRYRALLRPRAVAADFLGSRRHLPRHC